ncbi:MAG: hypothetical protein AB1483_10105 [Candidatus Zixiibacteriota bacterium]
MTTRLYYKDPFLLEFDATIVGGGQHEERFFTVLDRSAFYPTSGGQQHDTGRLNDVEIVDVIESNSGEVWHISGRPVGSVGAAVKGVIDKSRRQRHRQQHTAQHILSQTFVRLFGFNTVSVHLGEEYGAIEFDTKEISAAQLDEAEQFAMQIVFDNLPIEILFIDSSQVADTPLRRAPTRGGEIRVIKIGELDYSACGGTHCATTGEVGIIKIIGTEKLRGRPLVKFFSGVKAFEDYRTRYDVSDRIAQSLTCNVVDLPEKLIKLQEENKAVKQELVRVLKDGLPARAQELAKSATEHNGIRLVCENIGSFDVRLAGQLAGQTAEIVNGVAVLFTEGRLIIAVSEGCSMQASQIAKNLTAQAGLKGGGSAKLAQLGGAESGIIGQYREQLKRILESA